MGERVRVGRLRVDADLFGFVRNEALPGTGLDEAAFWQGTDAIIHDLAPQVRQLLERREALQRNLDEYYKATPGPRDVTTDIRHLIEIGYLVDVPEDFVISTSNVDVEVAGQAGPQLVVPITNARFATNAANARWGSLYDALYGTDVIDEDGGRGRARPYNPTRGQAAIAWATGFLDEVFPLDAGSHADVTEYRVVANGTNGQAPYGLHTTLADGRSGLVRPEQFLGFTGTPAKPASIVLTNNELRIQLVIDRAGAVGALAQSGLNDIFVEAALTAIMDMEDSVACVDPQDKVDAYRNWLGLLQRTLNAEVHKDGRTFTRKMNDDWTINGRDGEEIVMRGTALLFVRQVGHLMTSDAILDEAGRPVPEGLMDAIVCGLCSVHDIRGEYAGRNSRTGSIYAVKPKMHGPDEVRLACETFDRVEQLLQLAPLTIKVGIMDEERRTSANLKACIHAARDRVAFINTGFLDRTGDEIRTSTHAGAMVRKAGMKSQPWITAYENQNVDLGLACGLVGRAQIGKGMWAAPDNMADMMEEKIAHPLAGATCAWVPSPTAATLHALHYHKVNVAERQKQLAGAGPRTQLADLLTIPVGDASVLRPDEVRAELDNNVQSTLGYVVRWIDSGVGCSKVPDIHSTRLMEDRATCRISSQIVSNWLLNHVVSPEEVEMALRRMAVVVDAQNIDEVGYQPMAPAFDGEAFLAARDLLLYGVDQPSGYTEPILHARRRAKKAQTTGVAR